MKRQRGFRNIPFRLFIPGRPRPETELGSAEFVEQSAEQPEVRLRVAELLERYGRTSNDYFKLWPDKSHFFSASGNAVISYRVSNRVAVALGDPIGPGDELPQLVEEFLQDCRRQRLTAAFHQVYCRFSPGRRAI